MLEPVALHERGERAVLRDRRHGDVTEAALERREPSPGRVAHRRFRHRRRRERDPVRCRSRRSRRSKHRRAPPSGRCRSRGRARRRRARARSRRSRTLHGCAPTTGRRSRRDRRVVRCGCPPRGNGTLPPTPPSSSGLGRRPFTPVARVRIPLGVLGLDGCVSVFSRTRVEVRASSLRKWSSRLREPVRGPGRGPPAGGRPGDPASCPVCGSIPLLGYGGRVPCHASVARSRIVPCGCEPSARVALRGEGSDRAPDQSWQKVSRKARAGRPSRAHSERVAGYDPQETETSQRLTDAVICVACGRSSGLTGAAGSPTGSRIQRTWILPSSAFIARTAQRRTSADRRGARERVSTRPSLCCGLRGASLEGGCGATHDVC